MYSCEWVNKNSRSVLHHDFLLDILAGCTSVPDAAHQALPGPRDRGERGHRAGLRLQVEQ